MYWEYSMPHGCPSTGREEYAWYQTKERHTLSMDWKEVYLRPTLTSIPVVAPHDIEDYQESTFLWSCDHESYTIHYYMVCILNFVG